MKIKGEPIPLFQPLQTAVINVSNPPVTVWAVDVTEVSVTSNGVDASLLINQVRNSNTAQLTSNLQPDLNPSRLAHAALDFTSPITLTLNGPVIASQSPLPGDSGAVTFASVALTPTGANNLTASASGLIGASLLNQYSNLGSTKLTGTGLRRDVGSSTSTTSGSGSSGSSAGQSSPPVNPGTPTFQVVSGGTLTRTDNLGMTVLDAGVNSVAATSTALYDLENNGQLWLYNGSAWTLIDVSAACFGMDNAANLFILENNGNLRQYNAAANSLSMTPLATSVTALGVTSSGTAYFLNSSGALQQDLGGVVGPVDSGVSSFQLDGAGNVYELIGSTLYKTKSTTPALATGVTSFWVTSAGVVDTLQTGGVLRQGGVIVAANATTFQVAGDDSIYYLDTSANLFHTGVGIVDTGVQSFTLSSYDGSLYELKINGDLIKGTGASATREDVNVKAFAVSDNGTLYDLEAGGVLWKLTSPGWSRLDSNVKSILLLQGGGLLDLEQGGDLWNYASPSWVKWDSSVTSLAPATVPFKAQVVEVGGGTRTLGAILAQTGTATGFYEHLINGDLWKYSASGWTRLDVGVKTIAVDSQGNVYDLEQSGQLYLYNGTTWTYLDRGVQSIAVAANDTLVDLEANGQLWTFKNVWKLLDSKVISYILTGNTLNVTDQGGVQTFVV